MGGEAAQRQQQRTEAAPSDDLDERQRVEVDRPAIHQRLLLGLGLDALDHVEVLFLDRLFLLDEPHETGLQLSVLAVRLFKRRDRHTPLLLRLVIRHHHRGDGEDGNSAHGRDDDGHRVA